MTLARDRFELSAHLLEALVAYARRGDVPLVVSGELLDVAFEAVADVGVWNRKHPDMEITGIPRIDHNCPGRAVK